MKLQNQLNFRWSPFYEDIGLFGMKGEGKTTKATEILDQVPNLARWIWSPQKAKENYGGYGQPVNKIEDLKHGAYLWTGDYSKKTFLKICERATTHMRNLIFVGDDIHEQVTKQFIPPEFDKLLSSGRNRGISGIYLSTYPSKVHNTILSGCSHIFCFKFNLVKQIEWLRDNYFGNEAWLLLPKDLRNRFYRSESDPDILPRFSYLYRKDTDVRTQVMIPNIGSYLTQDQDDQSDESLNNETPKESLDESESSIT